MKPSINPLQPGERLTAHRTFTQADFDRFAAISGDDNPIHVDPAFASRTKFGRTVAHGMFLYANLVGLLGKRLPGALQVTQDLIFPAPTFAGEETVIGLEVSSFPAPGFAGLESHTRCAGGILGSQGQMFIRLPGMAAAPLPEGLAPASPLPQPGEDFKALSIGQSASLERTFSPYELEEYISLTGEANPLYTDVVYAQNIGLHSAPVPGPLLGALISCLLGTRLPGRGTNWLKQRYFFPHPAYPGEALSARVQIVRLRPDKSLVNLHTTVTNPAGELVCDGEALVQVSDLVNDPES